MHLKEIQIRNNTFLNGRITNKDNSNKELIYTEDIEEIQEENNTVKGGITTIIGS